MKTSILSLFLLFSLGVFSQKSDVEQTVEAFATAADAQNVKALEATLTDQFRAIIVGDELSEIDRATYLELIGNKTIGGDKRKVTIEHIEILDANKAVVRVKLDGSKASFNSLLTLVHIDGKWKIVQDLVSMTVKG
jgi:hypothetical protein